MADLDTSAASFKRHQSSSFSTIHERLVHETTED